MTSIDQNSIKEVLRAQIPYAIERYHVDNLALFGSWVRGEASETGDIDIPVDFLPGADFLDLSGLKIQLEDLFAKPVDVIPRKAIVKNSGLQYWLMPHTYETLDSVPS